MKRLIVLILSTIMSTAIYSQNPINLWDGEAPFNKKGVTVEEINENHRISKVTVPQLYHYSATIESENRKPAIVIVPGGGYIREAFDHEGTMVGEWFAARGVEAFVLKYRLPDQELVDNFSFVPLMDAQQAISWVRAHAKEYNIDDQNIGIIGFSAGGHLAASASTLFQNPVNTKLTSKDVRPNFSILLYPVISMDDKITHKGSKTNLLGNTPNKELVEKFSLENQVTEETPITLIVHSADDGAVPVANTEKYAKSLTDKGVGVTKIILPIGGHGFGFRTSGDIAYWTGYLDVWLKANVLKK
ncbi:MAG TPA: alpha/beta hydrolase [Marinilabiliaceae bacterium]|nr:alpha/beta hydrolase [Marinilabiliaceae bacterium]